MDMRDVVAGGMSGLEKLVAKIPGYRGYKEKEVRREADNLLWTEDGGLQLLNATKSAGDYGFLGHDNSERAVAWNVFRWLERSNVLSALLEYLTGRFAAADPPPPAGGRNLSSSRTSRTVVTPSTRQPLAPVE